MIYNVDIEIVILRELQKQHNPDQIFQSLSQYWSVKKNTFVKRLSLTIVSLL